MVCVGAKVDERIELLLVWGNGFAVCEGVLCDGMRDVGIGVWGGGKGWVGCEGRKGWEGMEWREPMVLWNL